MALLADAGIYVFTTVATPSYAINRRAPHESYTPAMIMSFFRTVDVMARYPNTLGIAVASGLIEASTATSAASVIKATVRDLKKYMKLKDEVEGQRVVPICYDATSTSADDKTILDYLCSGDASSSIDFWTASERSRV
ncbi:hypothetical protein LTR56_027629 [Elasticomyces elasticus]|nr:hypothetical protein LTR56_027629 [Elasticomyces elasticus]KAK3619847.1 hypothetical protein LTR22_025820 [Elasticomyces elasticus]KAK4896499.1 hypothetical protein LTR49_028134 [Elasticomyces elasticus]KAK5733341.1 hypothetical protein LTS12_026969 [Elasticomyces elasticus]